MDRIYVAIDLKSFYASVECVQRGLDPLNTNLVVADPSRTEKTICLAVSPSLKSYGIPGRARLFEVIQRVSQINNERKWKLQNQLPNGGARTQKPGKPDLRAKSYIHSELCVDPSLEVDYVIAPPQMALYMKVSAQIYGIYLKYVAPEDIFAYSVDEVFIDATSYLDTYNVNGHNFARMLIQDVLSTTGITATAGIGPNMYLCKVAMDVEAKHIPADQDGVRIAELDEESYKEKLWAHTPITDFWRVGRGVAARLEKIGVTTMGDIARMSLDRKTIQWLYQSLGKNAELLVDHAWGIEPTTIADVKAYRPKNNSISTGQVLQAPTDYETTKLIVWEMADVLSLDLVAKGLVTDQIVLTISYDKESLADGTYKGEITTDYYGRQTPKHAHGTQNLSKHTASTRQITAATVELFERIMDRNLLSRRIGIAACNVIREADIPETEQYEQMSLFDLMKQQEQEQKESDRNGVTSTRAREKKSQEKQEQEKQDSKEKLEKEKALQKAMLEIKNKYGKNAVVKVKNLNKGGTAMARNEQIGGHKA